MKALILNSGSGTRMGALASQHPKCMTEISSRETILGRQLRMLSEVGITQAVITTGPFESALIDYCRSLELPVELTFVHNSDYASTNYIYSIYLARELLDDDILLMHGDLVFENAVLDHMLLSKESCMAVSTVQPLPEKDFKAVIRGGQIVKVGVEFFQDAVPAQPLYFLRRQDWRRWLDGIVSFCQRGETRCYAENALNELDGACRIVPLDVREQLCAEVDDPADLAVVSAALRKVESRTVYMSFAADMLHSGHIAILKKASRLGRLVIGVLSDEAVSSYRRFPLLPFAERKAMMESISGVFRVVEQSTLSYRENLEALRPDIVVHGDDWCEGVQKPIRDEVVSVLASYGGQLVEFPYAREEKYRALEARTRSELSLPDLRRARLRRAISMKGTVTAMEAHSGITGLIVENTVVYQNGGELVDMTSRFRTIDDIMEVTTKPIIFDGDTGGLAEHFIYTVRSLERMGVSMVIIEDKVGLKKNSLFGNEVKQTQDSIEHFCAKIAAGKRAQKTRDFMICARIESLILEQGMEDALARGEAYVGAGADAIMIHSRKKDPEEIFTFVQQFRARDVSTPLVVVPTSFNTVTEEEWRARGVNVVIYANQLTRSGFPAMQNAARTILEHHRAQECDALCMPIKDIITLIPEDI